MSNFILSCESTVDMPFSRVNARGIPVLFYTYTVAGKEYTDDMDRDPQALPRFYEMLQKEIPSTSQLNEYQYIDFFTELLEKGDVLHIVFGNGVTLQMYVRDTSLSSDGTWSCPAFFEQFRQAI